jgi:UDP-GlcNAc:undecaprenyl-phosphate GlcNAc-1-phosphate transferase
VISVAVLLLSVALALVLTPAVRAIAERLGVVDQPGARKLHARPTARLGGLAVVVSAAVGVTAVAAAAARAGTPMAGLGAELWPMLAGAVLVFAVGLCDDVRGVSPAAKVLIEATAAAVVIGAGATIDRVTLAGRTYELGVAAIPVTLVWIVTITNAFNLVDGLDGLAAGLAVIAAATCALILAARGHTSQALLLVALLGAIIGFLPYNSHPASIFLGDSGSLVIGFVLAVTAITGWQKGATVLAAGVPLLIFALPILDTVTSITRRIRRRADPVASPSRFLGLGRILQPDREHIHHRLLAAGLSHRAAVMILYALSLALSGLALLTFQMP